MRSDSVWSVLLLCLSSRWCTSRLKEDNSFSKKRNANVTLHNSTLFGQHHKYCSFFIQLIITFIKVQGSFMWINYHGFKVQIATANNGNFFSKCPCFFRIIGFIDTLVFTKKQIGIDTLVREISFFNFNFFNVLEWVERFFSYYPVGLYELE